MAAARRQLPDVRAALTEELRETHDASGLVALARRREVELFRANDRVAARSDHFRERKTYNYPSAPRNPKFAAGTDSRPDRTRRFSPLSH